MKQIETDIIINADLNKVWLILTDFESYPHWNPFIRVISGKKKVGEKLRVFIQPPESKGMLFKPIIQIYRMEDEFRWIGKLGVRGIFDGEHYFKLKAVGNNQTKLVQGEIFSGILIPLMVRVFEKTIKGFELMNKALKNECEK